MILAGASCGTTALALSRLAPGDMDAPRNAPDPDAGTTFFTDLLLASSAQENLARATATTEKAVEKANGCGCQTGALDPAQSDLHRAEVLLGSEEPDGTVQAGVVSGRDSEASPELRVRQSASTEVDGSQRADRPEALERFVEDSSSQAESAKHIRRHTHGDREDWKASSQEGGKAKHPAAVEQQAAAKGLQPASPALDLVAPHVSVEEGAGVSRTGKPDAQETGAAAVQKIALRPSTLPGAREILQTGSPSLRAESTAVTAKDEAADADSLAADAGTTIARQSGEAEMSAAELQADTPAQVAGTARGAISGRAGGTPFSAHPKTRRADPPAVGTASSARSRAGAGMAQSPGLQTTAAEADGTDLMVSGVTRVSAAPGLIASATGGLSGSAAGGHAAHSTKPPALEPAGFAAAAAPAHLSGGSVSSHGAGNMTQVEVALQDPSLGDIRVQAQVDRTGTMRIDVSGHAQGTGAMLDQIAPLLHAAVAQQLEVHSPGHALQVTALSSLAHSGSGATSFYGSAVAGLPQGGSSASFTSTSHGSASQGQRRPSTAQHSAPSAEPARDGATALRIEPFASYPAPPDRGYGLSVRI